MEAGHDAATTSQYQEWFDQHMVNTQATSEDEGTSFAPTILKPRQQTNQLTNPARTGLPDGDRESNKEVAVSQGKRVVSDHDYKFPNFWPLFLDPRRAVPHERKLCRYVVTAVIYVSPTRYYSKLGSSVPSSQQSTVDYHNLSPPTRLVPPLRAQPSFESCPPWGRSTSMYEWYLKY